MKELTINDLREIEKLLDMKSVVYGYAMSPRNYQDFRGLMKPPPSDAIVNPSFETPILIDSRLCDGQVECFHDQKLWLDRRREQNEWDSKNLS